MQSAIDAQFVAAIGSTAAFRRRSGHETIGIETAGLIHRYDREGLFRTHNRSHTTSSRALSSTPQRTPEHGVTANTASKSRRPQSILRRISIWSRSSIACTTGPIRRSGSARSAIAETGWLVLDCRANGGR
jgi:hypothetical protein